MKRFLIAATALALSLLTSAHAHDYQLGPIRIAHPWARATVAGQPAGGAYLKLENAGPADRLLSVRSPVAASAELHLMTMDGNIMRMREVDAIALPAGQTVEFKPGGLHIMLTGLKAPLKQGERVPLTLRFEKAGEVNVELAVESAASSGGDKPAAGAATKHHHH
ncbi:copper chaperone PCu(A)C [Caldimonas tepidiphila]|uniref:copper chaperone PCu(A)C n=1 Tax=Caldimonas tepidiphila TaxID=2315841 RepID=UPI000E5A3B1B|nr:copper chaperone PCu(A)C [Caldimonas tepidiphila]